MHLLGLHRQFQLWNYRLQTIKYILVLFSHFQRRSSSPELSTVRPFYLSEDLPVPLHLIRKSTIRLLKAGQAVAIALPGSSVFKATLVPKPRW